MSQTDYKKTFARLMGYTTKYKAALFVAMIGMLGYAFIDVLFISKIELIIDEGLNKRNTEVFRLAPVFIIVVFLLRGFFNFLTTYFLNWVGTNVVLNLRRELFERYIQLPVSYHDQTSAGTLISKITFETEQIQLASSKAL